MRHRTSAACRAPLLGFALLIAACQGVDYTPNNEPVPEASRARYVKRRLEDALAFRAQKRFEAAEHQLRLALARDPDHARAHALLARTLEDLGRSDEAAVHAARARQLAPEPAEADAGPLVSDASGVLVIVIGAPETAPEASERRSNAGDVAHARATLASRVRVRLPRAIVTEAFPASAAEAERWIEDHARRGALSLRIDELRCAESAKDGPFALAGLTIVTATGGALPDEPARVRASDDDPPRPPGCFDVALARALDAALRLPEVARLLAAPAGPLPGAWPALAARALLPLREAQVAAEIARGRDAAQRPAPEPDAAAVVASAERERASESARAPLHREASQADAAAAADPETQALEAEVAVERRRRDELLAALRVDELHQRAPLPEEIAVLRVVAVDDLDGLGARLARERAAGRPIEARVLVAPDGATLARFYFEAAPPDGRTSITPLLREEDTDLDGIADRWTAYADGRPHEIWEDRGASGHANAHILLAPDGASTQVIEIDMDGNERPERVFHYTSGRLVAGDADTNGDGRLDRFEHFDDAGELVTRDEDLDGDGQIDVHSEFRRGKLLRRELRDASVIERFATPSPKAP